MKRQRAAKQSPNMIRVKWGALPGDTPDLCVSWGEGCTKSDASLVISALDDLTRELQRRGYDVTTVRFEIKKASREG